MLWRKMGQDLAGFAAWLDMTPADPDILAIPDSRQSYFNYPGNLMWRGCPPIFMV